MSEATREEIFLILTDVSGIQRLRVSDLGEKLTIPIQLNSVSITQATMVTSGCKATCNIILSKYQQISNIQLSYPKWQF